MWILDHLCPMCDPADGPGDRKQHDKHGRWKSHRPQSQGGIEVLVRIQPVFEEETILQRDPLKLQPDPDDGIIVFAECIQDLVTENGDKDMARKGKSTEEIIQALREAEVRLGQGETVGKICRGFGISEQTLLQVAP